MKISGIILAGGKGSRMGYINKGLVKLNGKTLIEHVIDRLSPQVQEIIISANNDVSEYEKFGYPVIQDLEEYANLGPMAGIFSCALHAKHACIQLCSCDSPYIPYELSNTLAKINKQCESIVVPFDGEFLQPLHMLLPKQKALLMNKALDNNNQSVQKWTKAMGMQQVDFNKEDKYFRNINTLEELKNNCL